MVMFPQHFFPIFSKNIALFEKIVKWKNIQNLISHEKVYIHFRRQTPPPLQKRLGPQKPFFAVFSENYSFLRKNCQKNLIFNTSFVIKKVMLIFGARCLLSLRNCQMCPQNSFSRFSRKILPFSKKLLNNKIFSIWFLIKKVIFVFGVRRPLTVASATEWPCCKQSRLLTSTFRNIPLLTYFLRQRFFFRFRITLRLKIPKPICNSVRRTSFGFRFRFPTSTLIPRLSAPDLVIALKWTLQILGGGKRKLKWNLR